MSLFHAQTQNNLTVRVSNLNNNKGVVQFGLYNVASKFPKVGKTYKMVRLKTKGSQGYIPLKIYPKVDTHWQFITMRMQIKIVILTFLVYLQRHMRSRIM